MYYYFSVVTFISHNFIMPGRFYAFDVVCMSSGVTYIPGDFNMDQGPHPGHIYSHTNMQRWKPQQSLRSSIVVHTEVNAHIFHSFYYFLNDSTVHIKFLVLQLAVIQTFIHHIMKHTNYE